MVTYIIAEMAWGHTGSLDNALKMLQATKDSGAQAIGIHLTHMPTYMTKNYQCLAGKTTSDTQEMNESNSIYSYLDKINLSDDDWLEFDKKAKELNIDLVVMVNDIKSLEFSRKMKVSKYVVSAASFLEKEMILKILDVNPNIIARIGGATLDEIDNLVNLVLNASDESSIELLVGIQLYPTPINQTHIASIPELQKRYNNNRIKYGLADHIDTDNPHAKYLPALSLCYGISSIEKHITTCREDNLEDFEAALSIEDFKEFVSFVRASEIALGSGKLDYLMNDSYHKYREVSRKKIVAKKSMSEGEIITKDNITAMRSDFGISVDNFDLILGKKINKDISSEEGITEDIIS
jgi:sialic acid synthase SpsE